MLVWDLQSYSNLITAVPAAGTRQPAAPSTQWAPNAKVHGPHLLVRCSLPACLVVLGGSRLAQAPVYSSQRPRDSWGDPGLCNGPHLAANLPAPLTGVSMSSCPPWASVASCSDWSEVPSALLPGCGEDDSHAGHSARQARGEWPLVSCGQCEGGCGWLIHSDMHRQAL